MSWILIVVIMAMCGAGTCIICDDMDGFNKLHCRSAEYNEESNASSSGSTLFYVNPQSSKQVSIGKTIQWRDCQREHHQIGLLDGHGSMEITEHEEEEHEEKEVGNNHVSPTTPSTSDSDPTDEQLNGPFHGINGYGDGSWAFDLAVLRDMDEVKVENGRREPNYDANKNDDCGEYVGIFTIAICDRNDGIDDGLQFAVAQFVQHYNEMVVDMDGDDEEERDCHCDNDGGENGHDYENGLGENVNLYRETAKGSMQMHPDVENNEDWVVDDTQNGICDDEEEEDGSGGGGSVQMNDVENDENWMDEEFDAKSMGIKASDNEENQEMDEKIENMLKSVDIVNDARTVINKENDTEYGENEEDEAKEEVRSAGDIGVITRAGGRNRRLQQMKKHRNHQDHKTDVNDALKKQNRDGGRHRERIECGLFSINGLVEEDCYYYEQYDMKMGESMEQDHGKDEQGGDDVDDDQLQCLGAVNAYSELLAKCAGVESVYLSGSGVTTASYGPPDLDITNSNDTNTDINRITSLVPDAPLLADIDPRFGNAVCTQRTILYHNKYRAAACHTEDQEDENQRCGHISNKLIVDTYDIFDAFKIATITAEESNIDDQFVIMAGADALADEGMDGSLKGCDRYVNECGADMLYPEASTDLETYYKSNQNLLLLLDYAFNALQVIIDPSSIFLRIPTVKATTTLTPTASPTHGPRNGLQSILKPSTIFVRQPTVRATTTRTPTIKNTKSFTPTLSPTNPPTQSPNKSDTNYTLIIIVLIIVVGVIIIVIIIALLIYKMKALTLKMKVGDEEYEQKERKANHEVKEDSNEEEPNDIPKSDTETPHLAQMIEDTCVKNWKQDRNNEEKWTKPDNIKFPQSTRPFNEYSSTTQDQIIEALALGETLALKQPIFQQIFDEFENMRPAVPTHVLKNASFSIIHDWVQESKITTSKNQRRGHHRVNESVQVQRTSYI